jgi:hypothetical protein
VDFRIGKFTLLFMYDFSFKTFSMISMCPKHDDYIPELASSQARALGSLLIRFCEACGCILEFRYTYVKTLQCFLLGYCCVNRYCAEFGKVFEPSWSDTLILSRLGFELRKFGGKKN